MSLWMLNIYLQSYTFCLWFILFLLVWIWIHKVAEYWSELTTLVSSNIVKYIAFDKFMSI